MTPKEAPPPPSPRLSKSAIAKGYDAVADRIVMAPAFYARCFQVAAPLARGQRVLDLGCGQGGLLAALLARVPVRAMGLDISGELCRRTRERLSMPVVRGDAEGLPFEKQSFDLVFMTEVLEHLQAPTDALKEVRRLLAPGGCLLVSVPNRDWPRFQKHAAAHRPFQPIDDHWYRKAELLSLLRQCGLAAREIDGFGSLYGGGLLKETLAGVLDYLWPSSRGRRKRLIVRAVPA